jgi:gluconate:H+ symporter, GntP family
LNPLWILLIGMAVVVGSILLLRLHAVLALIAGAVVVVALTPRENVYRFALRDTKGNEKVARKVAEETIGERLAEGFGKTAVSIGILIAMAAVVGKGLMDSGAAEKIVESGRRLLGDERAPIVFLVSGYVLAALVMSDTAFYLLIPLAKVMRLRSGKNYTLYVMCVVAGSVMTQSLVPPAPGPAAIVDAFHLNIATMIAGGLIVGGITSIAGFAYALWANRRWDIPVRAGVGETKAELELAAKMDDRAMPPLWASLLPIVIPVMLIGTQAIVDMRKLSDPQDVLRIIKTLGEKNIALSIAAAVALLLVRATRGAKSARVASIEGLASAGVMVLTICAGGAFGNALQHTDVAAVIQQSLPQQKVLLIPMAFAIACAIRTAQGSATVAMITAAGIVAPIAANASLGYHPVYLALAIGCGSKPIHWMNDAGFWIITKMSGFTEGETLKASSVMMAVMSIVGLIVVMAGAWMIPLG